MKQRKPLLALIAAVAFAGSFSLSSVASAASPEEPADSSETLGVISVPIQGTCGQSFNPRIIGGKAHWTIDCVNGNAGISGWVEDTRSDGKCIQVKATWSNGTTKLSPRACPKGSKKSFELRGSGKTVKAYVFQS